MPKPRKKRSLTGAEDKQDSTADSSQRLDQDSDVQKTELSASAESPVVKRAKMGKSKEKQYDKYCWTCHFEDCSEKCSFCPRVYHSSCLPRMEITGGDWTCPECQAVVIADKSRTTSPVMSLLSTDQLCNLLKYSLNRMEMHVPKDFCFGSSSSVFYPMDFPLLEKNIRKKVYTSPAAFLADAKWIFHNHSVYFPLGVPAVKTIMKVCQEEMREIETCPDCYLHAYSMKDKWFSEPCRKPHTLVWAKLKGFPIWPAKAVKTSNGNVDVRFFGGHERAWVPVTHCYFLSRDPPQAISSQKRNFECAHQEVELHIKLLSQRFGGFEYAPEKTPFNSSQIYLHLNVTLSKLSYLPQSLRDKRKHEATSLPAKRRLNRAHSAQEKKDEEKKEINVDQSLVEKDQIDKTNDCHYQKDNKSSLPSSLIETSKSHEEKSDNNDLVIPLRENTNSTKDLTPLLSEKTRKKENNDNSEAEKVSGGKVSNLTSLESESNSKGQSNDTSDFQNENRTEIPPNIGTSILEETNTVKDCDQENTIILETTSLNIENQIDTADSSNHEQLSTVHHNQSATNISEDNNEHEVDNTDKVLYNSNNVSARQEVEKDSAKISINNNNHDVDITKEVLDNSNSASVTQEFELDSTKIPINTSDYIDKNNIIKADLSVKSELIIDTSATENEDSNHDITSFDNKNMSATENEDSSHDVTSTDNKNTSAIENEDRSHDITSADNKNTSVAENEDSSHNITSTDNKNTSATENEGSSHAITSIDNKNAKKEDKSIDMSHPNEKDAKEVNKPDEQQAETQVNSVSSKQSRKMPSQVKDFKLSQEKISKCSYSSLPSNGSSLQNMKEIVIVVKNLKEGTKVLTKENVIVDSTTAAVASTPVALEVSKEIAPINKNFTDNKATDIIESINFCGKNIVNTKGADAKVINIIDSSVKNLISKVRRSSMQKRDKHTEDLLKSDSKLPEKREGFHVDDSHFEKNSLPSNSLRIRIVKGKVESENPHCSSASKDSENTQKSISKAANTLQEENSDFVQNNNESQVKSVTQKSEQEPDNISKQGTVATSTPVRKSKRPRKNFIIQFTQRHNHSDTHSNQDKRDSSNAVVHQEDCEKSTDASNHPDEPDIVKNFKATFEKIHKVKYAECSVLKKVIDYKSYSTHLNEAQKAKPAKPSTNLTNSPVVIKVPSNLSEHTTPSNDSVPSSTATNQLFQSPSPIISGAKSLKIIAIDNRSNCSNASTTKLSDLSQSCNVSQKQTEVSHCSNSDSECKNNKGETSNAKTLNIKDQTGTEIKTQDKCSNMSLLLQNVQVSLKENSMSSHKESNPANATSQTDVQNLHLPPSDKERNLFNILPVEKYARKLTVFLTNTLEEMCQDIINSGCMQVAMHSLETEVESLREKHKKDLADVKQNADLVLKEMRSSMETEKQNAVTEVKRQCEMEMRKNVEEAKKKQWCANCGKEAVFYCCWNTSYCDYPCQQTHWPQHMSMCGQNHVPSVKEQQIARMPNLGSDMTITQSSPGLPLEIQLTTHSPTQTNKNKKKPQSSSEKIPVASRGKGRGLAQSPNTSLQPPIDIARSSHMIYPPHYRLQGGQVIPVMLSHSTLHQQQCSPNAVMENKSHNVQHTVPFPYNSHIPI